jgi:site-specific DNA recombinase
MENAIIYARVSSKEQEIEGYSVPSQLKFLHEYASKHNYLVKKEFIDIETAKKSGRTQFEAMITYAKENKLAKHIIVEKTDRLLRNIRDYALIDNLIERSDSVIHLVKENAMLSRDSRSNEKFMFGIRAVVAKNFVDNLSEETKKGMLEKAEQGIYPSFAPYGYINVDENNKKTLKPDPESAHYIKKMFELYATGLYSLLSLKRKMITDGMVYRNGKNFYKHTVEVILKNEFYTGIFYWKGKKYENAQHKALISKELFRQVQSILINPKKYKSRKDLFAYTNLISCGVCGFSVTAQIQKKRYIYYHCSGYKGNCNQPYLREELIEEQITSLLENIQITDDIQEMILNGIKENLKEKIEYHSTSIQQIEKQVKILQNRIDQSYLDKLDKKISEEFWLEQNRKWLTEKENLSIKLMDYQKTDTSHLEHAGFILELAKKAPRLFKQANLEQKRKLTGMLFSNCSLRDENLHLELKMPFAMILESSKTGKWHPQGDLNPCFRRERAMS